MALQLCETLSAVVLYVLFNCLFGGIPLYLEWTLLIREVCSNFTPVVSSFSVYILQSRVRDPPAALRGTPRATLCGPNSLELRRPYGHLVFFELRSK